MLFVVLTTIQEPTRSAIRVAERVSSIGASLIVAGDRKGPKRFDAIGAHLLTLDQQVATGFELARDLPVNHYARKNIGYLAALQRGATCIYETDDDNAPNDSWVVREREVRARVCADRPWANVYRLYSDAVIWPRGFPLEHITNRATYENLCGEDTRTVDAPIQQGLADNSPDVDAVWRLTSERPFHFTAGPSVWLAPGTWCPFNSQTTWWWPPAFPLLYLPSLCSFRMTDIWRSFVAQRCLWATDRGLVFHGPEADQERNEHNLLRDFEDEVPGYLSNQRIVTALNGLTLDRGDDAISSNLLRCYEELVRSNVIPEKELDLVRAWIADLHRLGRL